MEIDDIKAKCKLCDERIDNMMGNYDKLEGWMQTLDLRQTSFESRQAKMELELENHLKEHQFISERINVNTKQLTDIKADIKPITEGVHAIQESVKVLGWIANIVKWVSATVIGTGLIVYSWTEWLVSLFKGNHP